MTKMCFVCLSLRYHDSIVNGNQIKSSKSGPVRGP